MDQQELEQKRQQQEQEKREKLEQEQQERQQLRQQHAKTNTTKDSVKEQLDEYHKLSEQKNKEEKKIAEKKSQSDLYTILGVDRDASPEAIKERYLQLALLYHPDKPTGDLQKFKDVCLAYKVLSSKKRRKEYDSTLAAMFNELREAERDVEYHKSDQFSKLNEDGESEFDEDAFKAQFEQNRTAQEREEMEQMEKKASEKTSKTTEEIAKIDVADLAAERDRDLASIQENAGQPVFDPNNFDASIFNQMFNDLKQKRQALQPVDDDLNYGQEGEFFGEVGEPVAWQGMGGMSSNWQGGAGWQGGGAGGASFGIGIDTAFGSTAFSGAGDVGGFDQQQMFAQNENELLQQIRSQANQYQSNPDIMHVRDQMENEQSRDKYYSELEARMAEIEREREALKYMAQSEYKVRPGFLDNPLGDPNLFQEEPMTIDAVKKSAEQQEEEEDEEDEVQGEAEEDEEDEVQGEAEVISEEN